MKTKNINTELHFTLSAAQAWELALFLKRIGLSDYRQHAASDAEAYRMMDAGERLRRALADQGCEPR